MHHHNERRYVGFCTNQFLHHSSSSLFEFSSSSLLEYDRKILLSDTELRKDLIIKVRILAVNKHKLSTYKDKSKELPNHNLYVLLFFQDIPDHSYKSWFHGHAVECRSIVAS